MTTGGWCVTNGAQRAFMSLLVVTGLTACQGSFSSEGELADISTTIKFAEHTYGVPASPRITTLRSVPKGGGRAQVGKPYKVRGEWYYPKDDPGYVGHGEASWYGPNFHGRLTANGEVYDMHMPSAAHKTFPLPSYAWVTNKDNGNRVMVRVNDRGPFADDREIDVSAKAAELLGFKSAGTADVKVEYIGRAPLAGDDTEVLLATFMLGSGDETGASMVAEASSSEDGVARLLAAYAPEVPQRSNSMASLDAALASTRINLGLLESQVLEKIAKNIPAATGQVRIESTPFATFETGEIILTPGADSTAALRLAWALGAHEAFIVRD